MANAAYLPIVADRYGALVRHIFVEGLDLTGIDMRAQVRWSGDSPGAPMVDLLTVTNGNQQGLRLVEVSTANGLPTSHVEIVINESTMEGLPYTGEVGDATQLAWDWQITIGGRKRRLAKGEFQITGDGVTGAETAPVNRGNPSLYPRRPIINVWSSARLTFGEEQVTVKIDGADLIAPFALRASEAADRADADRSAAEMAAATALAASRYFASRAAGEAGSTNGQLFSTDDGAGNLIYYRRTSGGSTEISRAITPASLAAADGATRVGFANGSVADDLRRTVWVERYGLSTSNTPAQNAAAFQAAFADLPTLGGIVRFRGTYVTDTIKLPAKPAVIVLHGEGSLTQGTPNTTIIAKVDGIARVVDCYVHGFAVIAHQDSDRNNKTNYLVNLNGFERCTFDLRYASSPAAGATTGRAHAVFTGWADSSPCYSNVIRLVLSEGKGPAKGIWFHNNGGSYLNNPNHNTITVRAYGVEGCECAVDVADTTQTVISFSLFEDCGGMTAVKAGNFTTTTHNWFELVPVAIRYGQTMDTTANSCASVSDQFSGTNKIVIENAVAGSPRFDNPLPGGLSFKNENDATTTNYVMPTVGVGQPGAPSFSFTSGPATLSVDDGGVRHRVDHHGVTTFAFILTATPAVAGLTTFRVMPPAGYEAEQTVIGVKDSTGARLPWSLGDDLAGRDFEWMWSNTSGHRLNVRVTLRKLP